MAKPSRQSTQGGLQKHVWRGHDLIPCCVDCGRSQCRNAEQRPSPVRAWVEPQGRARSTEQAQGSGWVAAVAAEASRQDLSQVQQQQAREGQARAKPPLPATTEAQGWQRHQTLPGAAIQVQESAQIPRLRSPLRRAPLGLQQQPCAHAANEPPWPYEQLPVWPYPHLFSVWEVASWQAPLPGLPHQQTEGDPCLTEAISGFPGSVPGSAEHQSFAVQSVPARPGVQRVAASHQSRRQNNCLPPLDRSRNGVAAEASVRLVAGSPQALQQNRTAQPV